MSSSKNKTTTKRKADTDAKSKPAKRQRAKEREANPAAPLFSGGLFYYSVSYTPYETPFSPQLGDQLILSKRGYEKYQEYIAGIQPPEAASVMISLLEKKAPIDELAYWTAVEVTNVSFILRTAKIPEVVYTSIMRLTLKPIAATTSETDYTLSEALVSKMNTFEIDYYDYTAFPSYMILRDLWEASMEQFQRLKPGTPVEVYFLEAVPQLYSGKVQSINYDCIYDNILVAWDGTPGEASAVSPWDIVNKRTYAAIQKKYIFPSDKKEEVLVLLQKFIQNNERTLQPINPKVYPYPIFLWGVKERLTGNFYRHAEALYVDLGHVLSCLTKQEMKMTSSLTALSNLEKEVRKILDSDKEKTSSSKSGEKVRNIKFKYSEKSDKGAEKPAPPSKEKKVEKKAPEPPKKAPEKKETPKKEEKRKEPPAAVKPVAPPPVSSSIDDEDEDIDDLILSAVKKDDKKKPEKEKQVDHPPEKREYKPARPGGLRLPPNHEGIAAKIKQFVGNDAAKDSVPNIVELAKKIDEQRETEVVQPPASPPRIATQKAEKKAEVEPPKKEKVSSVSPEKVRPSKEPPVREPKEKEPREPKEPKEKRDKKKGESQEKSEPKKKKKKEKEREREREREEKATSSLESPPKEKKKSKKTEEKPNLKLLLKFSKTETQKEEPKPQPETVVQPPPIAQPPSYETQQPVLDDESRYLLQDLIPFDVPSQPQQYSQPEAADSSVHSLVQDFISSEAVVKEPPVPHLNEQEQVYADHMEIEPPVEAPRDDSPLNYPNIHELEEIYAQQNVTTVQPVEEVREIQAPAPAPVIERPPSPKPIELPPMVFSINKAPNPEEEEAKKRPILPPGNVLEGADDDDIMYDSSLITFESEDNSYCPISLKLRVFEGSDDIFVSITENYNYDQRDAEKMEKWEKNLKKLSISITDSETLPSTKLEPRKSYIPVPKTLSISIPVYDAHKTFQLKIPVVSEDGLDKLVFSNRKGRSYQKFFLGSDLTLHCSALLEQVLPLKNGDKTSKPSSILTSMEFLHNLSSLELRLCATRARDAQSDSDSDAVMSESRTEKFVTCTIACKCSLTEPERLALFSLNRVVEECHQVMQSSYNLFHHADPHFVRHVEARYGFLKNEDMLWQVEGFYFTQKVEGRQESANILADVDEQMLQALRGSSTSPPDKHDGSRASFGTVKLAGISSSMYLQLQGQGKLLFAKNI